MKSLKKFFEPLLRTWAFWKVDHVLANSDSILRKRCGGYGSECQAIDDYRREFGAERYIYRKDPEGYKQEFKRSLFKFHNQISDQLDVLPIEDETNEFRDCLLLLSSAFMKLRGCL